MRNLQEALETFSHHVPNSKQIEHIGAMREQAKDFVRALFEHVPDGPDRTVAIRKVHEAMMTANKAIVNDPLGGI